MRNQFFYKRQGVEFPEGIEPFEVVDSFNIEYVIRSSQYAPNKIVVLLDDRFEQLTERKVPVGKNGKLEVQRSKESVCSEIFLSEEDSKRFRELTEALIGITKDSRALLQEDSASMNANKKKVSETVSDPEVRTATIDK